MKTPTDSSLKRIWDLQNCRENIKNMEKIKIDKFKKPARFETMKPLQKTQQHFDFSANISAGKIDWKYVQ